MSAPKTALLLIGFQNDYFSSDGILHGVFEDPERVKKVVKNTCQLLSQLRDSDVLIVETPIQFTEDYQELEDPIGILKIIKDHGAFKRGSYGAQTIAPIKELAIEITSLPGKRGLNCFSNTSLKSLLDQHGVKNVVIAGAVTSLCIDTAGREALDLGFNVAILDDCILSRTEFEQKYYLEEIMPMYSSLLNREKLVESLGL